jgi:hypothetical protein
MVAHEQANPPHYDELWRLKKERPFKPFTLRFKDGSRVRVNRESQFAFNLEDGVVYLEGDRMRRFKLADVTELELENLKA